MIVSRASSLPEVCGDAALYCDPQDPRDLAEKISLVFRDVGLRACLQAKGLRRSAEFSWKQCARHTFSILETVARSEQ